MDSIAEVVAALRKRRIDQDRTQLELAKLMCISRELLSRYENGKVKPDGDRLSYWAAKLDYRLKYELEPAAEPGNGYGLG